MRLMLAACVVWGGMIGSGLQDATRPTGAALKVSGVGLKATDLAGSDLAAMSRREVVVKEKDGTEAKYQGVTVEAILTKAGMAFGQSLRGPRLRDYLVAEAGDGYGVVFALPELTTEFGDRVVIVADSLNGKPLEGRDGPLRIVVSDEKKHARWVRNVTSLTVKSDK